jgi:hypothetical protein
MLLPQLNSRTVVAAAAGVLVLGARTTVVSTTPSESDMWIWNFQTLSVIFSSNFRCRCVILYILLSCRSRRRAVALSTYIIVPLTHILLRLGYYRGPRRVSHTPSIHLSSDLLYEYLMYLILLFLRYLREFRVILYFLLYVLGFSNLNISPRERVTCLLFPSF